MDVRKMSLAIWLIFGALLLFELKPCCCKQPVRNRVEEIYEMKDFKKILRTKNNVMVCFVSSLKASSSILKAFRETAEVIRGEGTLILVNCSAEGKKMCKKLKVTPDPVIMKHFKDGEYNADYDRKYTVSSMVNYMRDPLGDIPWEEDPNARYVLHIPDPYTLEKFLKKEFRPTLVMFYAPWCAYCKQMKPEYAAAATELRGLYPLAAMNLHRPENNAIRQLYNITSFPTVYYFEKGVQKYTYEGDNKKENYMAFVKDPKAPIQKHIPVPWSDIPDSGIRHLTNQDFDNVLKAEESLLVLFHTPWCQTCVELREVYEHAAVIMRSRKVKGMLSAVDIDKEYDLTQRFKISFYPLFLYFRNGSLEYRVNVEDAEKIVRFMENPTEFDSSLIYEYLWDEKLNMVEHLRTENFVTVLRKTKHALVMFYAPWCEHCRVLKPEFSEAAEELKNDTRIGFYAVDCTLFGSTCKSNDVKGYPTLRYYMYYSRATEQYIGRRMKDDFIKYILRQEDRGLDGILRAPSNGDADLSESREDSLPTVWEQVEEERHIVRLTDVTFDEFIGRKHPVLVIFYTNCQDCVEIDMLMLMASVAAMELAMTNAKGMVAGFNCTEGTHLADRYKITEFPTLKLFNNGHFIRDLKIPENKDEIINTLSTVESVYNKDEL